MLEPAIDMPRLFRIVLSACLGFFLAAIIGYALVMLLSPNKHDLPVEAAMTAIFVCGPIGAIVAVILVSFHGK